MEGSYDDSLTKKQPKKKQPNKRQPKKQKEKLAAQPKAAFETNASCTTKGASDIQSKAKGKIAEGFKAPRGLLGKRAGNSNATDIKPDPKQKKLKDSKAQDVQGDISDKKPKVLKKKKEPSTFKAPDSPPATSKGKASANPTTPEGFPTLGINPMFTPARPEGVSRLIKKDISIEEEEEEPSDWEFEDTDSSTEEETDSSEEESEKSSEDTSEDDEDPRDYGANSQPIAV